MYIIRLQPANLPLNVYYSSTTRLEHQPLADGHLFVNSWYRDKDILVIVCKDINIKYFQL